MSLDTFSAVIDKFSKQVIVPELAQIVGLDEAIIIQQTYYWLKKCGKEKNGRLWIYNTFEQWQAQFTYWSLSKIKRIIYSLRDQGILLIDKFSKNKSNTTNWYSLNYEKLENILAIIMKEEPKNPWVEKNSVQKMDEYSKKKIFP